MIGQETSLLLLLPGTVLLALPLFGISKPWLFVVGAFALLAGLAFTIEHLLWPDGRRR